MPESIAAIPCIFQQPDEDEPSRSTWVRIEPSHYGVSICIFKEKPDTNTPDYKAMASLHVDGCFMNQVKVQLWDENTDSEVEDPQSIILVEDVDSWKPQAHNMDEEEDE